MDRFEKSLKDMKRIAKDFVKSIDEVLLNLKFKDLVTKEQYKRACMECNADNYGKVDSSFTAGANRDGYSVYVKDFECTWSAFVEPNDVEAQCNAEYPAVVGFYMYDHRKELSKKDIADLKNYLCLTLKEREIARETVIWLMECEDGEKKI